jgi:flagellar protein FlaG
MDNVSNTSMPSNLNSKSDINLLRDASLATKNATVATAEKSPKSAEIESVEAAVKPSDNEVEQALDVVNQAAVFQQRALTFKLDEDSGRTVVTVIDKNTEQVIRQIPTEELLKVSQDIKKLQQEMGQSLGLLVNRKV